jgi:hypothetical protein
MDEYLQRILKITEASGGKAKISWKGNSYSIKG